MASFRNADVNLVIRAKNEADQAIKAVSGALDSLLGDATDASDGVAELGKKLGALDRAFAAISGKADAAGAAFERQQSAIASNKAALAAITAQAEAGSRALAGLREGVVDEVLAGRDQAPVIAQIKAVEQEQASLASRADKLTRTIATQEAALNGSRSSLLQLGATVHAVEDAQATAAARIELTTRALNEQAGAAQRVTAIQQRINDVTGVSRPAATGSAAAAASVLIEADNIFRRAEARTAEIQRLREQEAATAALADAERAEQANRLRFNITNDPRGAQARASAAAFIEAAEGEERMAHEAAQLRSQLDPLAAIQDRFNTSLARFRELAAAGKLSADELARAEQHLATQAEQARAVLERNGRAAAGGKVGLFGLQPYELTNLGYQINDVATQLASGTSLTQTLAQQGGQILQIFPRVTSAIVGAFRNPAFLSAAAVISAIALAFKEAGDQAERLREFSASLSFRADGGSYNAGALAKDAAALERLGASAKDADAAINAMVDQGVAADAIADLGRAAQETAERLGQSLPDAARAAAEAFTSGYDAVARLDDKLQFLTASEREHIRALFDAGNAEAARTEARLAYQRLEDGIATQSRGPWASAARSLGTAWDSLIKFIADSTPIKITIAYLNGLAGAVKGVGDAITKTLGDDKPADALSARIGQLQAKIRELQETITEYEAGVASGSPFAGTFQHIVDVSKRQLADAKAELARLERKAPDTASGDPDGPTAKRRAERLADMTAEQQLQALRQRGQAGLNAADTQRRAQLAGGLAFRQEMAATGDAVVAARLREIAVAKEQGDIDKANENARKSAAAAREREIKQFEARVIGAEGGAGKNPYSSAKGYGQFIESTFLSVYSSTPGADQSLDRAQILALRQNEQVARGVIDQYARENARFLESFGAKVTAGNLYLAHFLGAGGAKAVLTAPGGRPVDQIIARLPNAAQVLSGNQGYLRTDGGKGRYRTASELQAFIGNRVGDTGQAQSGVVEEQARIAKSNIDRQEALNQAVRHGNEDRQRTIDALRAEAGLHGTALLAEQRRQAIATAELELRQKAEDANRNLKAGEAAVVVPQAEIDRAKELAAALFDAQHARDALNARLADSQRPVDELTAQRDLLREQAEFLRSIGENTQADAVDERMRALGSSIEQAYDALIAFYEALSDKDRADLGIIDDTQLDNTIEKLRQAKQASREWGKVLGVSGQEVARSFAGAAVNAINGFVERVASGQNVFKALGQSVREFAASFISSVAQMILQLLAYMAAVQILRALGVPIPAGSIGVGSHHTGGIAGGSSGGVRHAVSPAMFAAALRYHNGGIIGLKPDEVPTILQRQEEVLTTADPRHRFNGGLIGGREAPPTPIKIVNTFDREEAARQLLTTRSGEKAILNFISANSRAVKAALS